MRKGDGSLVAFTVLSQWSVGIVLCLGVLLTTGSLTEGFGSSLTIPALLALLLIVTATTVSFLHLGNPVNAFKTLRNLATSWLSREILGIGLFTAGLLTVLASGWMPGLATYDKHLLMACSIAGLFLIWAMAGVYRISTIPAWNSGFTTLGFLTTSLSLGLVTCLLLDSSGVFILTNEKRAYMAGFLTAVLALEIAAEHFNLRRLASVDTGIDGPAASRSFIHGFFTFRFVIAVLAILALGVFVVLPESSSGDAVPAWVTIAASLILSQELAGRVLFYSSYSRIGL